MAQGRDEVVEVRGCRYLAVPAPSVVTRALWVLRYMMLLTVLKLVEADDEGCVSSA